MTSALPRLASASLTDVGRVRSENQDACAELQDASGTRLLVVADGMGGHQGGATASRLALEAVAEVFQRVPGGGAEMLRQALEAANERIYRSAQEEPALHGMGTTCVALLLEPGGAAWVAHVGDSRAYQHRDGKIQPITADHSAVAELQRRGMITAEEAAVHPRRNELLRSIGVEPDVEVDVSPVDVQSGDCFLLCSDGLSGVVSDEEISAVVQSQPPEQAVRTLVDSANARGGPDNITVIVAAVSREGPVHPVGDEDEGEAFSRSQVRSIAAVAVVVAVLLLVALFVLVWPILEPS